MRRGIRKISISAVRSLSVYWSRCSIKDGTRGAIVYR